MEEQSPSKRYSGRQLSDFQRDRHSKRTLSSASVGSQLSHLHHYSSYARSPYASQQQSKVDSRPAIVVEVGSRLTRVGLAGEMVPREIFRSEFHDIPNEPPKPIFPSSSGGGAAPSRTDAEQHLLLVKFFKQIVFRKLLTTMNNRRVLVVESLLTPTRQRDAMARALFECPSLAPHSILFAPSHLLATLPFNAKTSLVVDVGVDETVLFPVADGYLMLYSWETSTAVGAKAVEREVRRLMLLHGQVRESTGEASETGGGRLRKFNEHDLERFDASNMAEDIVFRFCFATTMQRGRRLQHQQLLSHARVSTDSDKQPSEEEMKPPPGVELPFGTDMLVVPGIVREESAEVLFVDGVDSDSRSLPQLILDVVSRVPIDLKRCLLSGLLLTGGVARMRGLLHRVKEELKRLCSARNEYEGRLAKMAGDVRFYLPRHNVNLELYGAWLGGAMFASQDAALDARSITREQWFAQSSGSPPSAATATTTTMVAETHHEDSVTPTKPPPATTPVVTASADDTQDKAEEGGEKTTSATATAIRRRRTVPDWTTRIDDYHKAL